MIEWLMKAVGVCSFIWFISTAGGFGIGLISTELVKGRKHD